MHLLPRGDDRRPHVLQWTQWIGVDLDFVDVGLAAPSAVNDHIIDQKNQCLEAPSGSFGSA